MSTPIHCENCGAPMKLQGDGRTSSCTYCGAELRVAVDSGQLAAGMALDLANTDQFLSKLADALTVGFGARTKVQREGSRVMVIELSLDPDVFIARRDFENVVAQHKKLVRGIALKTTTHPLDRWVDLLTRAISAHANTNANAAQALSQLRIK